MPKALKTYVRVVDGVNLWIGRAVMLLIFAMMGVLLWSSVSKTFFLPSLWTLEMAQFLMVAYFLLGGGYSMQLGAHVRMDLLYGSWSDRTKTWVDAFTIVFLIFYLVLLLYGAYSSTSYALEYGERSYSAWRPYMAPIKLVMSLGIFLMLLQAVSTLIKDIAKLRGEDLTAPPGGRPGGTPGGTPVGTPGETGGGATEGQGEQAAERSGEARA